MSVSGDYAEPPSLVRTYRAIQDGRVPSEEDKVALWVNGRWIIILRDPTSHEFQIDSRHLEGAEAPYVMWGWESGNPMKAQLLR